MPIHGYTGNIITANPTEPSQTSASGVWTTEQQLQYQNAGKWPPPYYLISRSLRFNSADSAYLNRTPASAGNRKTWTWSGWVKRGALGSNQCFIKSGTSAYVFGFFDTSDKLNFAINNGTTEYALITTQVFRDPSAWGMLTIAVDTTQATASNRTKIYWNGVQITAFGTANYITQNYDTEWNNTTAHYIGSNGGVNYHLSAYQTELHNIDGQALTPSSFGQTNASTGVWEPIAYTGTYGTNGFFLKFADNSGTTSTTLGKDSSGNGNNWTPNNFSVTAGAGNDSLVDTPTPYGTDTGAGGEVRGNYCTLNPLFASGTLSNGNLDHRATTTTWVNASGSIYVTSGKWYFEATNVAGNYTMIGVATNAASASTDYATATVTWTYYVNGTKYGNGATGTAYGASYTTNDVIGVALDMDAGTLTFYKNGVSQGTAFNTGLTGLSLCPWFGSYTNNNGWNVNFGQRPFAYTAPSGYKALCTQNLPTPTIGATSTTQAGKYFDATIFTATGTTQTVTNTGFQPDFLWFKRRNAVSNHFAFNTIAGISNYLVPNLTDVEASSPTFLTSVNSNGFTLGTGNYANTSTVVCWNWNAGGSNATNTSGTITSTVRANTTAGFSIVTYTGNATAGATVGHGLGVAPSMIIVKSRANATGWVVGHSNLNNGTNPWQWYLSLELTAAQGTTSLTWNNTAPTSTVFSLGSGSGTNPSATMVAYCFAAVAGYSAFGSYTGNGSTDGPFIYTGFRPRWIMFKKTSATSNWSILDTSRDDFNVADNPLLPNTSGAESTSTSISGAFADILSNGFKLRGNSGDINDSGATYIYAAFAESPFKYSLAR